jgi:malate dehydrogenase
MHDVAIVGAGELGGLLAHILARRNVVRDVRLIDDSSSRPTIASGKALDIMQAAPVERFATQVSGSADLSAAGGSPIVVVADRVAGGESRGDEGLMLLRRIGGLAPNAIVLCAGAAARELLERGVRELHIARPRLFGSAPEALAAAARAIVALEANGSPRDVALSVIGAPPDQMIIPWEETTIGGFAATRMLSEPARRRIDARLPRLWPPGPYALASAAAKVVEAVVGRSRAGASCFVAPDDSAGQRWRAVALPVRIGPHGVDVVLPTLNAHDRIALDNAMLL